MPDTSWSTQPLTWHIIMALAMLWPLMRLCRRAGLSPWWVLTVLVPIFGPALAGSVLAFQRWPNLPPLPKPAAPRKRD